MSTTCTTQERIAIVRLFSKSDNAHDVQKQWEDQFDTPPPVVSTILLVNRKFDETGSVEDLSRSGRPLSVLSEEKLEEIEEMVIQNSQLSIRHGAAEAGVSRSACQVAMNILNFTPYRPTLIVDLNDDDFDRRSQFCEIWLEKFENDPGLIDGIFWSDEAKFNMNTTVNRHSCTYWARNNPHIKFKVPNTHEGVMVWCGMTSNGLVDPYFFKENVTGAAYKQMLVSYAWPQLKRKGFYFQHDGAAAHYAVILRNWLDEKFPGRWIGRRGPFEWPARSPDLTPCDFFLWGYLKDIVFKKPYATISELQNRIEQACEQVTSDMCRKACRSVEERLHNCLEKEGQFLSN